jgi:Protein of unknown function (DUF2628)
VPTYTVHEPHPLADNFDERATRLVFVKEGFAIGAFAVPALWLLSNRLWLELIVYMAVSVGVMALITTIGGSQSAAGWATFVLNLIFGLEARNIHRDALTRKGYELIGVVTGRDLEDAERRFLSEWLPETGWMGAVSKETATASIRAGRMGMATG